MGEDYIWNWLNQVFSEEYVANFIYFLYERVKDFFDIHKLENRVYLNESVFDACVRDILTDLARIIPFHDIYNLNLVKITSYSAAWIIRRKPFQVVQKNLLNEDIFVNEAFSFHLLYQVMNPRDANKRFYNEVACSYINQVVYHLKYRNIHPQTIELMLTGFNLGENSI